MRGKRSRNAFTNDQILALSSNKYTETITTTRICYTQEFKNIFWQRYIADEHVKDIFKSLGYDTNILGDGRIYNFSHVLSLKMLNQNGLNGNHSKGATVDSIDAASMQHEIVYLRQQVEFLKKITSLEEVKKQKN